MGWQRTVNRLFGRATGYELRRVSGVAGTSHETAGSARAKPASARKRLLVAPVVIHSSMRSGSTLLRVLLDSHSLFHAPHELHLRGLKVKESSKYVERAMRTLGLRPNELEYLLWDRVLHWDLQRSGESYVVNKTPGNAFMWRRIATCWPDARYIFLLRHPLAIATSWHAARSNWTLDEAAADVLRYMNAVEEARQALPGLTVRYEELTADPEGETKRICEFLGVDWEPQMLDYGQTNRSYKAGLGDWSSVIKSGEIKPARLPSADEEMPESLRELCEAWGYVRQASRSAWAGR